MADANAPDEISATPQHTVHVWHDENEIVLTVPHGEILRQALLKAGITPYGVVSKQVNCGGRGICATCGVRFMEGEPAPVHWHDKLAARYGYPRLSCQITVTQDITIRIITDKIMWGQRDEAARYQSENAG